jgi:uncharacterized protein YoxC
MKGNSMDTVGSIAGLIAAIVFAVLVGVLGYPLIKLGKLLDEARITVRDLSDGALPLLTEVTTTVASTNQQLGKVDTITNNVAQVSTNVSVLTALFAATIGSPVVKVAAFSYGVRQAMGGRRAARGRR